MRSSHPEKELDRLEELEHYAKFIKTALQECNSFSLSLSLFIIRSLSFSLPHIAHEVIDRAVFHPLC